MPWVKCSERMPDINDKTSVSRDYEFVVRWQDEDGNWLIETMTNKTFDKFYIAVEGYEWLEGALEKEEPKPTRQELIELIKETVASSIPYVSKYRAFLISDETWTKLAKAAKPALAPMFDALDKVGEDTKLTNEEIAELYSNLEAGSKDT